jgi:hypothetical protein
MTIHSKVNGGFEPLLMSAIHMPVGSRDNHSRGYIVAVLGNSLYHFSKSPLLTASLVVSGTTDVMEIFQYIHVAIFAP